MKLNYLLMICFACLCMMDAKAQVAYSNLFQENHHGVAYSSGILDSVQYAWVFNGQEESQYFAEGSTIEKSKYVLQLQIGELKYEMDVAFRNLIVSLYIELELPLNNEIRTITGIYQKGQRWIKVKGVIDPACKLQSGSSWGRKNKIQNFDEILNFYVECLLKNIDFDNCIKSK